MSEIDHAAIYREIRRRVTDLVRDCPEDLLDRPVPATPEWRTRDVIAHLAGNTADMVSGNLEGLASDPWTQAQVDARYDTPIGDVLEEWATCSVIVEPLIADLDPLMQAMLITDTVTHEHDVRGALGLPGQRGSAGIAFAARGVVGAFGSRRDKAGAGALRIVHEAGEDLTGSGDPAATVRTSRFELVRAAVGRRSLDQIAAWDWIGDPHPETLVLGRFFPPRPTPLVE